MAEKTKLHLKTGANTYVDVYPYTIAEQVEESDTQKFVTGTEKTQITTNKNSITSIATKVQNLESSVLDIEEAIGTTGSGSGTIISRVENLEAFEATKGKANGIAPLDYSGKILESYLPASILGQVQYRGVVTFGSDTATVSMANDDNSETQVIRTLPTKSQIATGGLDTTRYYVPRIGDYWVTTTGGTFDGTTYVVGDWIIYNGVNGGWGKVDNTDAISSITMNGTAYTAPFSFYAPTTVGTNNQILKSNGTGAPTWISQSSIAAGTAVKLATARTISIAGAATGSASFDGSANLSISITLANGIVATAKIADSAITTAKIAASAVTSAKIADSAITTAKLASTGVTAGTYSALTVNVKGQVTSGAQMLVVSETDPSSSLAVGGLWFEIMS